MSMRLVPTRWVRFLASFFVMALIISLSGAILLVMLGEGFITAFSIVFVISFIEAVLVIAMLELGSKLAKWVG